MVAFEHSSFATVVRFAEPYEDSDIVQLTDRLSQLNSARAPYVLIMVNEVPTPDHWRKLLVQWYKRERPATNAYCRGMIRVQSDFSPLAAKLEHAASHALSAFPLRSVATLEKALALARAWLHPPQAQPDASP
ncbi:hypothetical protein D8B23_13795 [Verminephrobacter aporrectodeae subsp. tuberculatae]|uniref:Uncharacterized protein n=1 Tax=Verminephrobacter aporrectodeae subsp. tuberculatae TaxID=1110392 RepID=A0ABT3KTH3_9BURK|nr:hypothetical protein [Verminephrobacter aporrectodeae]MCW5321214.1 hypothetical protein [Verminephrobacter aporrectodeae subsp. tuberculatae]MCW8199464.1 hypothetical protein [Verminephrobacter aporrectodeae subsp. tuberculatae]